MSAQLTRRMTKALPLFFMVALVAAVTGGSAPRTPVRAAPATDAQTFTETEQILPSGIRGKGAGFAPNHHGPSWPQPAGSNRDLGPFWGCPTR
jgi:hypothetical protein